MIKGIHGLFYTPQAEAARDFIRDKLGFAHVDAGDGWLIFGLPQAEFGVHPGERAAHEISFWCDDIEATVKELADKGVEVKRSVRDDGWGLSTAIDLPGGLEVLIYEPRHAQP